MQILILVLNYPMHFQEHPSPKLPGVEAATGSLGHGLPIGNGMALSSRITGFEIPYAIDGGTVSLLVSLLLFFLISFCSRQPKLDPDIEAVMDM